MNILYDVIIIGASANGKTLFHNLLRADKTNIALVSTTKLPKKATKGTVIQDTAVQLTYLRGMIGVALCEANQYIWGKNIVVATGRTLDTGLPEHSAIVYDVNDLKETPKFLNRAILLWGHGNDFAYQALMLAKKFKHVYACYDSEYLCEDETLNTLVKLTPNLLFLSLCSPKKITFDQKRPSKLETVTLTSGSILDCAQLLAQPKYKIDFSWADSRFIGRTDAGFADITQDFESKKVPGIYAIGPIVDNWQEKLSIKKLINVLLEKI